jgi:hypothetical protein
LHSQKPWASGKHAKLPPGQYNTSISWFFDYLIISCLSPQTTTF